MEKEKIMESKVKTIEIVFENSESVLLDAEQFEWFHLSCIEHTVSGRGYYINKSLWTNDVGFVLKENIQEPDNYNIEGDKLGYWLDDSSLFGRTKSQAGMAALIRIKVMKNLMRS